MVYASVVVYVSKPLYIVIKRCDTSIVDIIIILAITKASHLNIKTKMSDLKERVLIG